MPKKTHFFERKKESKKTIINTDKGQRISGQDTECSVDNELKYS
jgi:hypothetical protein